MLKILHNDIYETKGKGFELKHTVITSVMTKVPY